MVAGEPCKGSGCAETQPCPLHTRHGKPRRNRRVGDDGPTPAQLASVTDLFTDEKKAAHSEHGVPSGKRGSEDTRTLNYVRQRLGKRWSQIHEEVTVGMYTWDEFVENLDAEELARGQLKAEDGTFRGRPPQFIPRQFYLACQREMVTRFNRKIQANLEKATDELIKLGTSDVLEPKDRIKVLQYMIERVVGKIPDKVEVSAADPWETIIGDILSDAPEGMEVQPPSYIKNRQATDSDA